MSTNNSNSAYASAKANGTLTALNSEVIKLISQFPNGATIKQACHSWFTARPNEDRDISGVIVSLHVIGQLAITSKSNDESVYSVRTKPTKLEKLARKLARESERQQEVLVKTANLNRQLQKETNKLLKSGISQSVVDSMFKAFQLTYKSEKV